MMTKFEIFIGEEVTLQSLPMVNHIYATQDFKYPIGGNWNNCRITISYYVHTSKNNAFSITSLKTSSINIYVGNDIKNTCRSIVSQLDLDL